MGGHIENPTYQVVCSGFSGHLEVVEVTFDENIVSFEDLVKLFFEIHDFTQTNGQGSRYWKSIFICNFYIDDEQKRISEDLIKELNQKVL